MTATITFTDTIDFDSKRKKFSVRGRAFESGLISTKKVRVADKELAQIASSMANVPILKSHQTDVDSVCGRVSSAHVEGNAVLYKGQIQDKDIQTKIEDGLISKVSVGLQVGQVIPFEYENEEWLDLSEITTRELSLVVFPALESASVEQAFEFSIQLDADSTANSESDSDHFDTQGAVPRFSFEEYMDKHNMVSLEKAEYDSLLIKVEELKLTIESLDKLAYINTCDPEFAEAIFAEGIDKYRKEELKRYNQIWAKAREYADGRSGSRCVVNDGSEDFVDSKREAKEDIRQLLFGKRRDGLKHKKLTDIRDITMNKG